MEVRTTRFVKTNGIKLLLVFFLAVLSVSATAGIAMPVGNVLVQLVSIPAPPTLSLSSFPIQNAQANSDFKFTLKPYISGRVDVRYLVTSTFKMSDGTISNISATNYSITGLPSGLTQINNTPGDCSAQFRLIYGQSCHLHLSVDTEKYPSAGGGDGPIVSMLVTWNWKGSGANSSGSVHVKGVAPIVSQRISAVVPPVLWPTQALVTSEDQDGLQYDPSTLSIIGKPTKPGVYHFQIGATNGYATAAPQALEIHVSINPKDKPVFKDKPNGTIASAMPGQHYQLNLMDLIVPTPGFMVSNQVRFRIDTSHDFPSWLSLDENDPTLLRGYVSPADVGKVSEITLIASSNSGGDSEPLTIQIPVAYDPAKKPIIAKDIELTGVAGVAIHKELRAHISDPANDSSLQVIIDKIEPAAPWLILSSSNPTELNGVVPESAVGQVYQISLHANTAIGGSSDVMNIPLRIAINKEQTPRFYAENPNLPILYKGQPYSYDFVVNNNVYPRYNDIPYIIELAEGHNNPSWVRIEDNKLIVDSVPDTVKSPQQVFFTIKNVPGGKSEVLSFALFMMS